MTSLFQRLSKAWLTPATTLKMINFALIGLGNTAIDFGVFTLAYEFVKLPLIASNVAAWIVAVSGSYIANTMTTFRAESGQILRRKDYFTFVASGILGMIATTTTLVVLSHYVDVMLAKLISILAGFAVNFAMSNLVVFRARRPKD